jgi:hypothetical protein
MKMSKVAKMIGVDRSTIDNWIKRKDLEKFFSDNARNKGSRDLIEQDIFVANTINHLRKTFSSEWGEIAEELERGYLVTDLSIGAAEVDTGTTPVQQFTRSLAIAQERDLAIKQTAELQERFEAIEGVHKREVSDLRKEYEDKLDEKEQQYKGRIDEKEQLHKDELKDIRKEYEKKLDEKEKNRIDEIREASELKYKIGQLEAELKFRGGKGS